MIYVKYLKYIIRHKWLVMIECFKNGLYAQGITHDLSKLLPSEFVACAKWFYGEHGYKFNGGQAWEFTRYDEYCAQFDYAWLKHQRRNKHHWQYWLLKNDSGDIYPLAMPERYAIEMVCDWIGAGRAINGKNDLVNWYTKNKKNIVLHEDTRLCIDKRFHLTSGIVAENVRFIWEN